MYGTGPEIICLNSLTNVDTSNATKEPPSFHFSSGTLADLLARFYPLQWTVYVLTWFFSSSETVYLRWYRQSRSKLNLVLLNLTPARSRPFNRGSRAEDSHFCLSVDHAQNHVTVALLFVAHLLTKFTRAYQKIAQSINPIQKSSKLKRHDLWCIETTNFWLIFVTDRNATENHKILYRPD